MREFALSSLESKEHARMLARVGVLYYMRGHTQKQIADRIGVSRPTVSRMIREARERGIVEIRVAHVDGLAAEIEGELEERFGLREAVVTEVDGADSLKGRLGAAAADYLVRSLVPGASLGITWGTTLQEMVRAVPTLRTEGVTLVQTLGGVGPPLIEAHAASLPRRLARRIGADLLLIQAPGIVGNATVRDIMAADPEIRATLDAHRSMTTAFVGIGALHTNPILGNRALANEPNLPPTLSVELEAAGAVGDIALRFFDAEGQPISTSLDERIIGVDLSTLAQADTVVGVAGGVEKAPAIRAALEGRLVDVLVTDVETANVMLA